MQATTRSTIESLIRRQNRSLAALLRSIKLKDGVFQRLLSYSANLRPLLAFHLRSGSAKTTGGPFYTFKPLNFVHII